MDPGKGILRAMKPREEGLISNNIKPNETRTPPTAVLRQTEMLLGS
jgi:hypothetical protein